MNQQEIEKFRADHLDLVEGFVQEVEACFEEFVDKHKGGSAKWQKWGCEFALYGYIMWCFAYVDLLSAHKEGSDNNQSQRMIEFLVNYMNKGREEATHAINLWRHVLMHTAQPRYLFDSRGKHSWILHWQHPDLRHFEFEDAPKLKLQMTLFGLAEDLRSGVKRFLNDLAVNQKLQENVLKSQAYLASHPYTDRLAGSSP